MSNRYEAWTTEGEPLDDAAMTIESGGRVRARALGLWFGHGTPGEHNAITDVDGVRVGHCTIVHGNGKLEVGKGPARTGVTAILPVTTTSPDYSVFLRRLPAGGHVLNGAGEMVGLTQVQEWGLLETPIVLTNTLAIGTAHHAVVEHMVREVPEIGQAHDTVIPLIAECDDSWLNDIAGHHVKAVHVHEALQRAAAPEGRGVIAEGSVGSGTGMVTFDFAGGIGTSSRKLSDDDGGYTVGVLVQSNFGRRKDLRLGGIPVGAVIDQQFAKLHTRGGDYGSIIVVVATDAPLLSHQLKRLSSRASLGIGRTGSGAAHGSGELVLAFSTAQRLPRNGARVQHLAVLGDEHIDPLFRATIDAVEEAIANALCMAADITGVNGHRVPALPLDRVQELVASCTPPLLRS